MTLNKMPESADAREARQLQKLRDLFGKDHAFDSLSDLSRLPVTRKDQILAQQLENPPFGGHSPSGMAQIFQSPGPIYEPGFPVADPWRLGRFAEAVGMSGADVLLNTFSYHFTPAGAMFESAARAVGAVVFPSGPGNTKRQVEVAADIGVTTYAGTPDFLKTILEKADEDGVDLSRLTRATVSAGPLFPQLRQYYQDRGILCRQCYATADVGLIAYENAESIEGMFVDDDVIVEIVSPGTGDPVQAGEIGEVVVTILGAAYQVLRFSVGDLSALMPESLSEPRPRIVGWRGRADQATKVKGMFIRPEQVSRMVSQHPDIERARVEVTSDGMVDEIHLRLETRRGESAEFADLARETFKLKTQISLHNSGELPRDGILVSDLREPAA